jgi:hypothetical protein
LQQGNEAGQMLRSKFKRGARGPQFAASIGLQPNNANHGLAAPFISFAPETLALIDLHRATILLPFGRFPI